MNEQERMVDNICKALNRLTDKQSLLCLIAAGVHAGNRGMTADGAAETAFETYRKLRTYLPQTLQSDGRI